MTAPKISRVSPHGFWLLLGDEELLLPFTDCPLFKDATIERLCNVNRPSPDPLYWPLIDVDLSVESIRHPECFPLISRGMPDTSGKRETASQLGSSSRQRHRQRDLSIIPRWS